MNLRDEVLAECRELGADMAGIAPVDRFENAPLRMSPEGLLPSAKCVVVAGIHHPDACIELGGEPSPHDIGPYRLQMTMNAKLDDISFTIARHLEKKGFRTIPVAASNIWRYRGYKDLKVDFAPDIVHRYAAVAAGLGEIGWNGLFLTPEYGPRQRVVSIITEAGIEPDPMYEGPPACDKCMACVRECPTDAFRKEVKGINRLEIGGRVFEFPDTNKWRCAWAENFGLSLEHELPENIDEAVILEYLEKYGRRGGEVGSCLKFCMAPDRRYYDASYSRTPRRKKDVSAKSPDELIKDIGKICHCNSVDFLSAGMKDKFSDNILVHPGYHLPDVESVISIGIRMPDEWALNRAVLAAVNRRLDYASFEIARFLDGAGYSAVACTKIQDGETAKILDVYDKDAVYRIVLTSAALPESQKNCVRKTNKKFDKDAVKRLCAEAGADMAGVFSVDRFDEFLGTLNSECKRAKKETVVDRGFFYGGFIPEVKEEEGGIKTPRDWLPGAKSVIVIGLRMPEAPLDFSKITPAEAVGPFAFVKYESLLLAKDCALRIIKELGSSGTGAVFSEDLSGLASMTASSRGRLPDMRSNMYEAVLAGLAYPGVNGYPLTGKYGPGQRFIAIVTGLELESDPLYEGEIHCAGCQKPCVTACPAGALKEEEDCFTAGGREFKIPRIDCYACDWAKLYGMSGEEGAKYSGVSVDEPVPSERTAEKSAAQISRVNWGVQKRHINVVEECLRVCPAGKERMKNEKGDVK